MTVVSPSVDLEPLRAGDNLTWEEFIRRWEAMPELKQAELIEGIVYMTSPVSMPHADITQLAGYWLRHYQAHTPGTESGANGTWYMEGDGPQPDQFLRLLSAYGGQSGMRRVYASGAPELIVEVSYSSASYDLHQKKRLYERAGVREYGVVLLRDREVRWHRLGETGFDRREADEDGVIRSEVFPGLWLNVGALWERSAKDVLVTLEQGLASDAHAAFVKELEARAEGSSQE